MKCGGKSDSFWKISRWKSRRPLTAHSCYDRMNLVCKFFGIVPAFSIDSKRTSRRWILQVLNYSVMIAVMLLYAWIMQLAVGDAVTQRTKSVIMGRVMESVNSHYGSLILVSLFVGQQLHSKTSEVPHVLHFADCQLKRFGFVVELKSVYWFMNGCLILSVIVSSALCKGSISIMERHAEVCSSVKRTIIVLQYVLTSYAVMCLHATFCVISIAIRFRALNRLLRMYFPTTPSCGGFLTTTTHTETVICNEKEQLAVLKQIKILHDKLNDVVELVNYCFSVQITFCVGLCFVIGVVCSFGLFRAFIYRNELFYMGVLNFVWYMYYLFFVLFFIAVGSKITREGKRIGVLVHKAINCATSSAVINELNIFSQQLLHRSPVITCGLFVYDWTLLYTMIGATATYLIILIQFDVSFPNLVNVNGTNTVTSGV